FLPGEAGPLFREFAFVMAISVAISGFVALSLGPMIASRLPDAPAGAARAGLAARMEALAARAAAFYDRSLAAPMHAPWRTVGVSLMAAGLVAASFWALERELVPREDRGRLVITLIGPDGVNLAYTDRQVAEVERLLQPLVASGIVENVFS